MSGKARILFVDDEKRVLNSMRGLFRRDYELFLTTEGAEAVRIACENEIDVIVADQRMPGMTGIEVLGAVKQRSPRTVRILLTGYADPSAVEGSINIGEVFRFLSKPCPPKLLRETLGLAIDAAKTAPIEVDEAISPATPSSPVAASAPPNVANTDAANQPAGRPAETGVPAATPESAQPAAPVTPPASQPEATATSSTAKAANELPDIPELADRVDPQTRHAHPQPAADPLPDSAKQEKEQAVFDNDETEPALPILNADDVAAMEDSESSHWQSVTNVVLSEDKIEETQENVVLSGTTMSVRDVGVVVFTVDSEFAATAIRAVSADRTTILATTLVKVAQAIEEQNAGVLVTDFTTNSKMLQKMIGALKQHMPQLVTIVVSAGRDTTDMINLINYGQVFRYVLKPVEPDQLRNDINAAAIRYLYLVNNPESVVRHQVIDAPEPEDASTTLNRFLGRIRSLPSHRTDPTDTIT